MIAGPGQPLCRSPVEPAHGLGVVACGALAEGQHQPEIALGLGLASLGRPATPRQCLAFLAPGLKEAVQGQLRLGITLLGLHQELPEFERALAVFGAEGAVAPIGHVHLVGRVLNRLLQPFAEEGLCAGERWQQRQREQDRRKASGRGMAPNHGRCRQRLSTSRTTQRCLVFTSSSSHSIGAVAAMNGT